jgi:hypothetical protein
MAELPPKSQAPCMKVEHLTDVLRRLVAERERLRDSRASWAELERNRLEIVTPPAAALARVDRAPSGQVTSSGRIGQNAFVPVPAFHLRTDAGVIGRTTSTTPCAEVCDKASSATP